MVLSCGLSCPGSAWRRRGLLKDTKLGARGQHQPSATSWKADRPRHPINLYINPSCSKQRVAKLLRHPKACKLCREMPSVGAQAPRCSRSARPQVFGPSQINALTLRLGEGRNDAATNPQLAGAHGLLSSTHGKGHGSDAKAQRLVALLFHAVTRGAGQGPGSVSPPGAAGADVAADHVGEGGEQESGDTSPTAPCCRGADVEADTCSPCR